MIDNNAVSTGLLGKEEFKLTRIVGLVRWKTIQRRSQAWSITASASGSASR